MIRFTENASPLRGAFLCVRPLGRTNLRFKSPVGSVSLSVSLAPTLTKQKGHISEVPILPAKCEK